MRPTMTPKMKQRMIELWKANGEGWMHAFTAGALKRLGLVEGTARSAQAMSPAIRRQECA